MTGMSFRSLSVLHSLSKDQPSRPGIKTSSKMSFGCTSRISSIPFSLLVAPSKVRFNLEIVLLIKSCIATSSSTNTTKLSCSSRSASPSILAFTSNVTVPFLVNLKPLLRKLVRHCLSFVSS